ncbi:hypothetical protein PQX77_006900 [Marasmius sp. AFHP31]|nr:hypothetical protein PQX77_006900 [Marasmius sp. AFHP31]
MEGVSAADTSNGGILTKVFIMGVILVVTVAGMGKWFYSHTLDDLKNQIDFIHKTIKENTALGRDLLRDLELGFRERLAGEYREMKRIEESLMTEPNRWKLIAWIALRWQGMRDVERCYGSLIELKREITAEVNQRKNDVLQF